MDRLAKPPGGVRRHHEARPQRDLCGLRHEQEHHRDSVKQRPGLPSALPVDRTALVRERVSARLRRDEHGAERVLD